MNRYSLLLSIFLLSFYSCKKDWIIQNTDISDGIHDIEMIGNHTGYVYSYGTGKLLKTTNGGHSWHQIFQFDSLYFEQIQFLDKNNGYLCGEQNTLLKTSSGGSVWDDCHIDHEAHNILIYGMYFSNIDSGFAAAILSENGKFFSRIYQTTNSAQSWSLVNELPHMILNIEKVGDEIWGSGYGVIIRNIDLRERWSYTYSDLNRPTGQIRDFATDHKGTVIAVSFAGKVLVKRPKKEEWEMQEITSNRLRSIDLLGKNKWLITGDKNKDNSCALFQTTDNGKTWEKIENKFPDIHRVHVTEKYIWITGKEGFIAKMRI